MNKREYRRQYYLNHKKEALAKVKEWRQNNPGKASSYSQKWKDNNKNHNRICNKKTYLAFCISSEYEQIENYELAKADNFKGWDCHHRLELHPDGSLRFTRQSLKDLNLYLNRPARELIFLTHSEHAKLHSISRKKRV